jgi:hypothetical protein
MFEFSCSFLLTLIFLSTLPLVPVFAVAPPPAKIHDIWPRLGSLAGGTYLVIRGVGWTRGGLPGTTRAFIDNKECIQNQGVILDSTDTNFVCWTPPLFAPGQEFPDPVKNWWAGNSRFDVRVEITTGMAIICDTTTHFMNLLFTALVTFNPWYFPVSIAHVHPTVCTFSSFFAGDGQVYSASCDGYCLFWYRDVRTPIVGYASLGGHAGSLVKFYGSLREKDVSKYWVRIGGQVGGGGFEGALCNVDPTIQLGWRQLGDATISDPNRMDVSSSFLVCRVPNGNATVEAGRYPLSLEPRDITPVSNGFGQAFFSMHAPQTPTLLTRTPPSGGGGTVTMQSIGMGFTVRPLIESVSATAFGLSGGSLLTIIGSGFSTNGNNEVLIGHNSVKCTIVQFDARRIVCRTGSTSVSTPSPQPNLLYPGGQGLLSLLYVQSAMPQSLVASFSSLRLAWIDKIFNFPTTRNATSGKFLASFVEPTPLVNFPPTFAEVTADSLTSRHFYYGSTANEDYVQELTGFFMPPVSAFYSFYTRGDDQVVLWLSSDADPRNAEIIAISRKWEHNWWMNEPGARISQKIWCTAGEPRFFRLMFVEFHYDEWFDVAIRVHSDYGTNMQVMQLLASDTQRMVRSAPLVQHVEISCDAGSFVIELDLGTGPILTEPIKCNADALTIRMAIATASKDQLGKVWANVLDYWIAQDFQTPWEFQLDRGGSGIFTGAVYHVTKKINEIFIRCYGAHAAAMKPLKFLPAGNFSGLTLQNGNAFISYLHTELSYGDPFYWPAPMDFFRVALSVPAIRVVSNGLLSVCQHVKPVSTANLTQIQRQRFSTPGWLGQFDPINPTAISSASQLNGCAAVYDASLTPTVVSVVAPADPVVVGNLITLTGTNFLTSNMGMGKGQGMLNLTVAEMNLVFLNGTSSSNFGTKFPCPVVSVTATQIICSIADLSQGNYNIFVEIGLGRGCAVDQSAKMLTFESTVSSIAPLRGSRAGGTVLTISGAGFYSGSKLSNNIVMMGNQACNIITATTRRLTCVTPPTTDATATPSAISNSTSAGLVTVNISVNGLAFGSQFKYEVSATPLVTMMTPTAVSSAVTSIINFTLSNIDSSVLVGGFLNNVSVTLSNRVCEVSYTSVQSNSAVISCILKRTLTPPMPQQRLSPTVAIANLGFAALDADNSVPSGGWKLDYCFRVSSVSPSLGSLAGGTTVSVFGCGFTAALFSTSVRFERPSSQTGQPAYTVPCTVNWIAADGSSLKCVMSRPSYEYVPEFASFKNSVTGLQGFIIVTANLLDSICAEASSSVCNFTFSTAATPVVASAFFNMTHGIVTGSLLAPPVNVFIGTFVCNILSVADGNSTVQFEIPPHVAGLASLRVHSNRYGSAEGAWGYNLTNPLQITNVTLIDGSTTLTGSEQGGQLLVLTGNGFSENPTRNIVSIGNKNAIVITAEPTKLIVATQSNFGSQTLIVSLTKATTSDIMFSVTTPFLFVYNSNVAFTPTIFSVNPTSVAFGKTLTVIGNGFGTSSANSSVEVGSAACFVSRWTATEIICTMGLSVAGTHSVLVFTTLGLARPSTASANRVSVALVLNSAEPLLVGMHGGATITLQGAGFASPSTSTYSKQPSISVRRSSQC